MAKLKAYQVAAAALVGGFPPNEVPTAVAVARGESSFNTGSENSCCTGLWQIHRSAHADKIARHGGVEKLKDPVVNAMLAREIWTAAGGWCTTGRVGQCNPWQAYGMSNAGMSWKAKLAEGAKAYAEVRRREQAGESLAEMLGNPDLVDDLIPDIMPDIPNPLGGVMDVAGAIAAFARSFLEFGNRIGSWISDPGNWMRVAEVVGGGMLFFLGLRIAFHKQVMGVTKEVVQWVVPGGKAAKLAKGKI